MHPYLKNNKGSKIIPHLIGGIWQTLPANRKLTSPYTGQPMCEFNDADPALVNDAVIKAKHAAKEWGESTHKDRARILYSLREQILKDIEEITATISFESGKTLPEAKASLMKGLEVLEFALSIQNLDLGGRMEVSQGIYCEQRRVPLGVVAGITPFNFPAMVPMWMMPIAIAAGNSFIWKPSDKVPMTSQLIGECFIRAGLPPGVLTILQGGVQTVNAILDHPDISAVGFVGSTAVAKEIYKRGTANLKRVLALGGAKNHIILLPDADAEMAAQGIADSFTGCAGQRCMASSVLLAVGDVDQIINKIAENASKCSMGAIITKEQVKFLHEAISKAQTDGAKLLLDGRNAKPSEAQYEKGNWLSPTILDHVKPGSDAARKELFGPVLSIIRVKSLSEAFDVEASGDYGNATSVFTQNGAIAEEIVRHATSGMIGVNIGVPVPREPFSFGGHFESKFGSGDITGVPGLNFWTELKKITVKWAPAKDKNWMS